MLLDSKTTMILSTFSRWLIFFALLISLIPKGSVSYFYIFFSSAIFSIAIIISLFRIDNTFTYSKLIVKTFLLIIFIVLYILFQSTSFDGNIFANPNWEYANEILKSNNNSISISPSQTKWAVIQTVSPFIVFTSVLILSNSEKNILNIWKFIVYIGILFSVFSILNLYFWPSYILFEERVHDAKNLTGFFVNRNTAATYIGICIIATISLLAFRFGDENGIRILFNNKHFFAKIIKKRLLIILVIGLFIQVIAIHQTNSRGGIIATYAAIFLFILTTVSYQKSGFKLIVTTIFSFVFLGVVLLIYGQNTLYRIWIANLDSEKYRICAYISTIDAIKENWIFGTGLGTFVEIFPVYRNELCGIYNQWEFAHNFYLEGYLTLGVVFLLICMYVYWILIKTFISGIRNRVRYKAFPVGGLAVLLLISIHSLVDFSLQIHAVAVLAASVLGVAAAFSSRSKKQKPSIIGVDVLSKH